jgi:CO dehydrogenase/acetyl-CoA synthase alpha subunit
MKMERAKGFELSALNSQPLENQSVAEHGETPYTQLYAQILDNDRRDLSQVVKAWAGLPAAFKAAIMAIVNSTHRSGEVS